MWRARKDPEKGLAKVTFAEDVASLANASGGVLVIGVRDRPREIVGLGDIARELENKLKFAEYEGDLVSFHQVVLPTNDGEKVCLVIVVAQARSIVAVHDGQGSILIQCGTRPASTESRRLRLPNRRPTLRRTTTISCVS
jgi:predicted HTH transcriptional regulator